MPMTAEESPFGGRPPHSLARHQPDIESDPLMKGPIMAAARTPVVAYRGTNDR